MRDATYQPPNFDGDLDTASYIARVPPNATCKGVFFHELQAAARRVLEHVDPALRARVEHRYVAFRDYALSEHMRLTAGLVPRIFPRVRSREGMRQLGWLAYPAFASSLAGRLALGLLGDDIGQALGAAPRAISLALSHGRAAARRLGAHHYQLEFEAIYGFLDCYYVGVVEGVIRHCGATPRVTVCMKTPVDGTFDVTWS